MEAENFVIYWLDFFARPMTPDGLTLLWSRRKGAIAAAGTAPAKLPIAEMEAAGMLCSNKKGLVSLAPGAVSAERLEEAWKESERGNWSVSLPVAFKAIRMMCRSPRQWRRSGGWRVWNICSDMSQITLLVVGIFAAMISLIRLNFGWMRRNLRFPIVPTVPSKSSCRCRSTSCRRKRIIF